MGCKESALTIEQSAKERNRNERKGKSELEVWDFLFLCLLRALCGKKIWLIANQF